MDLELAKSSGLLRQSMLLARVDFSPPHRPPSAARVAFATVLAIAGSLLCDAVLVYLGESIFPSTKGYPHFQFSDYAKLTVIGVIVACIAWPVVARLSSAPRWLFARLAVLVTFVLWAPDAWILYQGQPARAVAVLFVMHLAIALVTYNLLVHLAPPRPATVAGGPAAR
jgi:hypothetical protein